MFGWVRPRVRKRAREIAQTVIRLRAASNGKTYNELSGWVIEAGFAIMPEHVDNRHSVTAFTEGPPDSSDILYSISKNFREPDQSSPIIMAEGYDRLAGLYITIVKNAKICVDVSAALKAAKKLGADSTAMKDALLKFPEFIDLLRELGIRR